jgi:hypothetical protein
MSIKTPKRIVLGLVASLVFAPFAAIAPASAADVAGTSVVGPVRVSFTGTNQDTVSKAVVTITAAAGWTSTDVDETTDDATINVVLTQAPSAAATLAIAGMGDTGSVTLAAGDTLARVTGDVTSTSLLTALSVGANVAGTYKGTITIDGDASDNASDLLVVPFSFTTVGAPASISLAKTAVEFPAVNTVTGSNTITLKDAAGNTTQSSTVDSLSVTISSTSEPTGANIALTTGATLTDADLSDGTVTYVVTSNGTADVETVTVTPLGTLPALGVTAVTFTVKTVGYGVETAVKTALTTPSATNLVAAGTVSTGGAEAAYKVDTSVSTLVFTASGYTTGAAYKITVTGVTGSPAFTVKDDTSNTTATTSTTGAKTLYGIAGATGSVVVTVVVASPADAQVIGISANNANDTSVDAADARVTYAAAAYAVTVTAPAVTPSLAVTSAAIAMAGKVADTYGNPVSGAVVTVTGTVTPTGTALTATATSAADGTWSLTMPAAAATTTSVSYVAAAVKTGVTITAAAAVVVNFNATGSPDSLTYADALSDQDTATTLNPVTTYPAAVVIYTGSTGAGNSDEIYTIATKSAGDLDSDDVCVAFTPTTSPAGQVVVTGSAGIKFTTTSCATAQTLATLKDTVTVASGSAFYAVATKTGENTVTMTSGNKTASAKFYAFNTLDAATAGDAIRNLSVDKTSLSLKPGEFAVLTIKATDAFGNAVQNAVAGAVVTVRASGSALVEGPTLSKQFTTTDEDGNIMVGVVASQVGGAGTITITGTGAQLGAAAGAATGTTAGTNGLTASVATRSVAVTVVVDVPEVVYEKPTLSFVKSGGRIILSGTAVDGEGDIIIYTKRIGTTAWKERAKTLEVSAPGDFNGSIKAIKNNVVIRVKQEGTGLFSNQIIVLK